jgi:hypothetical protein
MSNNMPPLNNLPGAHQPPSASSVAASAAERTRMMGSAGRILVSIAAIAGGYKLIQDSWNGSQLKRDDAVAAAKEHAEWADMEYGWGHYSGQPWMDQLAHKFKRLLLFGPMNLKLKWQEITIRMNSWVNDVILPNLLPIALVIAGIGGLGGFKVFKHTPKVTRFVKNHVHVPTAFKTEIKNLAGKTASGAGKGLGKLLSLPFKSPAHLGVTAAGLLFGSFFLQRFQNSYGHDGQHNFFRDLTNSKGH